METEVWKDVAIEPYGEFYQVSNLGRVRSKDTQSEKKYQNGRVDTFNRKGKILKERRLNNYLRVTLYHPKLNKIDFYIHRLVLITFESFPINDKMQVNHKDCNKSNNSIDNLEWVTNRENTIHAYKNNLIQLPKGLNNRLSKQVAQIDVNTNEVIKKWDCIKDVWKTLGYNHGNIAKVCSDKYIDKTAYGFKWKYI
jgi:hypothetical protein